MRLDDDIVLAHALADASGATIRPYFRAAFAQETKADASPVTQADREAEAAIRMLLSTQRPHDGIIGEEFGEERADAERVWVLDPIDGTRSFIAGRPIFGTLIALLEQGRPVLGVIDQPISGERWIGPRLPGRSLSTMTFSNSTGTSPSAITTGHASAPRPARVCTAGPSGWVVAAWRGCPSLA